MASQQIRGLHAAVANIYISETLSDRVEDRKNDMFIIPGSGTFYIVLRDCSGIKC